jgi:hypothetical protein
MAALDSRTVSLRRGGAAHCGEYRQAAEFVASTVAERDPTIKMQINKSDRNDAASIARIMLV